MNAADTKSCRRHSFGARSQLAPSVARSRSSAWAGRIVSTSTYLILLGLGAGCAHYQWRPNFKVENPDFFLLAQASLDKIEPDGAINTVVLPRDVDRRVRAAFRVIKRTRRIKRVISPAEIPRSAEYKLPSGYFLLKDFTIQYRVAKIEGQVGPVTREMTKANIPHLRQDLHDTLWHLIG